MSAHMSAQLLLFRDCDAPLEPLPGAAVPLTPTMGLGRFFRSYFAPCYLKAKRRSPRTTAEYATAVGRWADLTGDPPLQSIDQACCARFACLDGDQPGRQDDVLSPNTVRKHCCHLQHVLDAAGPWSRERRHAATEHGLFGLDQFGRPRPAPWVPRPDERDKPPVDGFTLAELSAWIAAARTHATAPITGECTPAAWWEALIRFLYNAAVRIGTALRIQREWIRRVNGVSWLEVPGAADKKRRPRLVFLSPAALAAVDSIGTQGLVFPWPRTLKNLHDHRRRLLFAADLPEKRWFGFHAVRKAAGTELYRISPDAARQHLCHGDLATTVKSYVNPAALAESLAGQVGPALARIPQP